MNSPTPASRILNAGVDPDSHGVLWLPTIRVTETDDPDSRCVVVRQRAGQAVVATTHDGLRCEVSKGDRGWWLVAPHLGIDSSAHEAAIVPGARLLAAAIMAAIGHFGAGHPVEVRVEGVPSVNGDPMARAATVAVILVAFAARSGEDLSDPEVRSDLFRLADLIAGLHRNANGRSIKGQGRVVETPECGVA